VTLFGIQSAHADEKLDVVATLSILGDFVKNVGGDQVFVNTLVGRGSLRARTPLRGHDAAHRHGPDCGHEAVPHGDNIDDFVDRAFAPSAWRSLRRS
jgi:hypothetical protein